jgi:hypothetical protein
MLIVCLALAAWKAVEIIWWICKWFFVLIVAAWLCEARGATNAMADGKWQMANGKLALANARVSADAVAPPKVNTNSYGCTLAWDAVPFAEEYKVFLGETAAALRNVTNVASVQATFRIWETNAQPWVGVKSVVAGQESDMSQLLTRTNYLRGWVESKNGDGGWQLAPGTEFDVETTEPLGLYRMHGQARDNWPRQP